MIAQMYAPDDKISLIGGANAYGEFGYASMLHRLMYDGKNPDTSNVPDGGTYDFAAKGETKLIREEDNHPCMELLSQATHRAGRRSVHIMIAGV